MNLKIILNAFIISLFFLLNGAILLATVEIKAVPVSEKVYVVDGLANSGNVAFLVTEAGVLVVDSGTDLEAGQKIVALIKGKTDQPICFVVLTHYHGDHTYGLPAFPAGTKIIAQENLIANQKREREELKSSLEQFPIQIAAIQETIGKLDKKNENQRVIEEEKLKDTESRYAANRQLQIIPPTTLYKDKMTINLGNEIVEISYPGPTHTNDNSVVYFPGQKVIHMGDMVFHKFHPYIDWQAGSNTANWIIQLGKIANWPLGKVIPGHGAVAGKAALAEQARYLIDLRVMVALELKKGTTLAAMQKTNVLAQWSGLGFPDLWPFAIEAVYHELGGK